MRIANALSELSAAPVRSVPSVPALLIIVFLLVVSLELGFISAASGWNISHQPLIAEIDPELPGLEAVTLLPGEGWALWSEDGRVLWIVAPPDIDSTPQVPIWGCQAWDWDENADMEIVVASEDSDQNRRLHLLDHDGSVIDLPGPPHASLTNLTMLPSVSDLDGDGDADFILVTSTGHLMAAETFDLQDQLFDIELTENAVYVIAADVHTSTGTEAVVSTTHEGNGAVYVVTYETSGAPTAYQLPTHDQEPLGLLAWPPAAVAESDLYPPMIGICDESGRVYRWTGTESGFSVETGYPAQNPMGTSGPGCLGAWDGEPAWGCAVGVGAFSLLVADATEATRFPEVFHPVRPRLGAFQSPNQILLAGAPDRLSRIELVDGSLRVTERSAYAGPLPELLAPSSAPDAPEADLEVRINGHIVGASFLPGDYVPREVTIEARYLSGRVRRPELYARLQRTSSHKGRTLQADQAPAWLDAQAGRINAIYELDPGTYLLTISDPAHIQLFETTLKVASRLEVSQLLAYPSPARDIVEFTFVASIHCDASLDVYTLSGRRVFTLRNVPCQPGYNAISWNLKTETGSRCANGTYLFSLRIRSDDQTSHERGRFCVLR